MAEDHSKWKLYFWYCKESSFLIFIHFIVSFQKLYSEICRFLGLAGFLIYTELKVCSFILRINIAKELHNVSLYLLVQEQCRFSFISFYFYEAWKLGESKRVVERLYGLEVVRGVWGKGGQNLRYLWFL